MAIKNITFDPTSGVPYASNLTIQGGSDFSATFNVVDTSNSPYPFTTAWSASSQIAKSVVHLQLLLQELLHQQLQVK